MDPYLFAMSSDLKGRIAEALVELLLKNSGNRVQRHGHEWRSEALRANGELTDRDRIAPDLKVFPKSGPSEYIEVKYREHGRFHKDDHSRLRSLNEHWGAKVVLVQSSGLAYPFMVLHPPYFYENGEILEYDLITHVKTWNINPEVLTECERLMGVYQFFQKRK